MNAAAPTRQRPLQELEVVRLLSQYTAEAGVLRVGDTGTIVHRYRGGESFEVEFVSPVAALVTLRSDEIARAGG